MSETVKKYENADKTLKIIEEFLITIKILKIFFRLHQKLIKENKQCLKNNNWKKY